MIVMENLKQKVNAPTEVASLLKKILAMESPIDQEKEHFWSLGLSVKNQVLFIDLVSLGTLTQSLVHPREVFRLAVIKGAANIIVAHNHPSGDPAPSDLDKAITEKLRDAGEILGIPLLDHVIIGNNTDNFTSMKDKLTLGG